MALGKAAGARRELMIRVALSGNPNVGKSVIFNKLTGSRQRVGNWPGKTVEKKEGVYRYGEREVYVVDLPGTYSLTAYSVEEQIARDYIIKEKPDVVVDVVDATNLERNLYLLLQLIELGAKVVIALNKMDLAEASRLRVDANKLEEILEIPVVATVAPAGIGLEELREKIVEVARAERQKPRIRYSRDFEEAIAEVARIVEAVEALRDYNPRWLAIKLLEEDREVLELVGKAPGGGEVLRRVEEVRGRLEQKYGDVEMAFISERYRVVGEIVREVVRGEKALEASDALDRALLDRYLGLPVFISVLWIIFQFTFIASAPFSDMIADFFALLSERLVGVTGISRLDYMLFGDYGLLNGVGTVLSFVPLIMTLYFALSLFEDFGYMARAAFLMDRIMRRLGLTGRAIIPMILGFGCNIAGVYGTRTIPDEGDRIIAIVTNPLMLCSARLVVFTLIAEAFWGPAAGSILLSLYLASVLLAILVALVLRRLILRGEVSPFVMELPPYQMPSLRVAATYTWLRASLFFKKAGTVILAGLLVLGALATTDAATLGFTENVSASLAAALGHAFKPLFEPLGWDWILVVSVLFGFVAKEVVIGTMAMLYGVPEELFGEFLRQRYDPVTMYAYMLFVLIYIPCLATVAAIKHETGSWKYALLTVTYDVVLAYLVSLLASVIGRALFPGA